MALAVTIDGVDRTDYVATFTRTRRINEQGTGTLRVVDPAGSYAPAVFDTVAVTLDGSPIFSGIVVSLKVGWVAGYSGRETVCQVVDLGHLARRVLRNGIEASGQTLKQVLQKIVTDNLSAVSVSLDAAQVDGPTFASPLTFAWMTAQQALDYLSLLTGYVYRIDDSKVLSMWLIGSRSGPATFSESNRNVLAAEWDQELGGYFNAAWITYGPSEVIEKTDTFPGDGVTREWNLHYYVATPPATVTVTRNPGAVVTVYPVGEGLEWSYTAVGSGGKVTHTGGTVLDADDTVAVTYSAQFPHDATVQDAAEVAAHDDWWVHLTDAAITDYKEAEALVTASIRRAVERPQRLTLRTLQSGNDAGEVVTVSLSAIGASGSFLIEEERYTYRRMRSGDFSEFTLSLTGGDERASTWVDYWRNLKAGSAGVGGAGSGASISAALGAAYWASLGGAVQAGVQHSTWVAVRERRRWTCPVTGVYTARVEVWTQDAATSVQPRIYDLTDSAVAATGSSTTATSPEVQTLALDAEAGHLYELQLLPGNTTNEVYGTGEVTL